MPLQAPTIVLFDMDGTTVRHLDTALLQALETFDDWACKGARLLAKIHGPARRKPPLFLDPDAPRRIRPLHRMGHALRQKRVEEIVEPCPGVKDVLDMLYNRNIPLGIISNGLGRGYGHDILKIFDLEKYFEVRVFREDVYRAKPAPDPLLQALKSMKRPPAKTDVIWYIGDRPKDVEAALACLPYLPCPVQPIAYTRHAASTIIENNLAEECIFEDWAAIRKKLETL